MPESQDAILDAANALRLCRHIVEPDADSERWRVDDGDWIIDAELLVLAVLVGL